MPLDVRVPALGESVVEATVGAWQKHTGEVVEAGEPLVQLETEKVNVDVSAERGGVLGRIAANEGAVVKPGDVLAVLEELADGAMATAPTVADRPHASPVARRMAEQHGLDLSAVAGTGTAGRVTREDVERHLTQPLSEAAPPPSLPPTVSTPPPAATLPPPPQPSVDGRGETRQRLSRRRLTIAQRLLEAHRTAAMLTTFNEVDMTAVMQIRSRRKDAFKERHGVGLGYMSFFTRAVVDALKAFPLLNAEIQGEEVVLKHYYDIGIAVGTDGGLVVPVVRDADGKGFAAIERELAALADKARTNTLTLDDLRGGTFTITNGGVYGSLMSTPILSPPQVGILGMHAIQQRPVARDDQVVIRPMMYLALTYDHRIVDGREAVQFLVHVKSRIEEPIDLLLDA